MLENCPKKSLHNKFTNTSKTLECMICKEQVSSDSPNFVTWQNNNLVGEEEEIDAMPQL